ncbi:hypothetical protein N9L19_01080 [bacterium]|nr:hypothetical protein [bacterium]
MHPAAKGLDFINGLISFSLGPLALLIVILLLRIILLFKRVLRLQYIIIVFALLDFQTLPCLIALARVNEFAPLALLVRDRIKYEVVQPALAFVANHDAKGGTWSSTSFELLIRSDYGETGCSLDRSFPGGKRKPLRCPLQLALADRIDHGPQQLQVGIH